MLGHQIFFQRKRFTLAYTYSPTGRESGQDLKAGTQKQDLEHKFWRSPAYWTAHSTLLATTQDHLARVGTDPSEPGPPTSIIKQEKTLQTCQQAI